VASSHQVDDGDSCRGRERRYLIGPDARTLVAPRVGAVVCGLVESELEQRVRRGNFATRFEVGVEAGDPPRDDIGAVGVARLVDPLPECPIGRPVRRANELVADRRK